MRISSRIEPIPFPPISVVRRELAARADDGLSFIDLCQAVPDYPPPQQLRSYMAEAVMDSAVARYTPDEGLPQVRKSVADWYALRYGQGPSPEELCLTIGASQAFWLAMSVLCAEGDEVIVPLPAYFDHPMGLAALGVVPRFIPYAETVAGKASLESIEQRITPQTRALLLVSPSNPSGVVLTAQELEAYFELARSHGIVLVVDETYHAFLPEDASPHRLFARDDWQQGFIHIGSFGKTFALTGYRAGALAASAEFIHHALKVQDSMAVCQPHLTQLAVAFGCEHLDAWVRERNAGMQKRQALFREEFLASSGAFELMNSGGFFAWVRHPFRSMESAEVVSHLVREAHIACLPGAAFGPGLDDYLRLAIGNLPDAEIAPAVQRLAEVS